MTTVLVTGGAGFIGSNLTEELVRRRFNVKVIDNLTTGNIKNLQDVKDKIEFIKGDITNLKLLKSGMKNVDFVLHQAAIPSVPRSLKDPIRTNKANVEGTLKVLIAARDSKVKRVIYASSSSVYGDSRVLPKNEYMRNNPLSPYACTKMVGEYYCKQFSELYKLDTISLRYFNVFGPKQNPDSQYAAVIPLFIKKIMNEQVPIIFGDGTQSRDFTFVENVIEANILAMEAIKGSGEVINIACGKRIELNNLVIMLNKILDKKINPVFTKSRQAEVKHSLADISKAKKILGYRPKISFEEGLKKTAEYYKDKLVDSHIPTIEM